MDDVYSKIPNRKQNQSKYIERIELKLRKCEQILAKFGCYEDGKPITCLHCPYAPELELQGEECDCKFESLLFKQGNKERKEQIEEVF